MTMGGTMAANRKRGRKHIVPQQPWYLVHLPKILAGLLATGAAGGTVLGNTANERVAIVETKAAAQEKDIDKLDTKVTKIDRRTIRIEEHMHDIADKLGVKREEGPHEQ